MSLPSANASADCISSYAFERTISPSVTVSRFSLAISRPMTLLPGMTSTTRTLNTDNARARSLARLVIWLAFTPGAGRNSKRVTTGPGCTATTSDSMPKSFSFISTRRDSASSASLDYNTAPFGDVLAARQAGADPAHARPSARPEAIDDGQPGDVESQRQPRHPRGNQ